MGTFGASQHVKHSDFTNIISVIFLVTTRILTMFVYFIYVCVCVGGCSDIANCTGISEEDLYSNNAFKMF